MKEFEPPISTDIEEIANQFCQDRPFTITRFMTGLCHYVFDVKGPNKRFVVRVCHPDNLAYLQGHLFWSNELKDKNLPLAKTLLSSIRKEKYSYVILEYLDGVDLGQLIDKMNFNEKQAVVKNLIEYQDIALKLPEGNGFGWGLSYNCPQLLSSWNHIIDNSLVRAKEWISSVGKVDLHYVEEIEKLKKQFEDYFHSLRPKAFFHDLTTKNLLLSPVDFSVRGFVDIDEMAFGDKFFHISLMNMALLANNDKIDLVEIWLDNISASEFERRVIDFYTLIHCVTFMGENGKYFNKEQSFSEKYHFKLKNIYQKLLSKF